MKKLLFIVLFLILAFAPRAHAQTFSSKFEISGWIPYWRSATGTQQFLEHIDTFKEVNPFGYTVKSDGRLVDTMELTKAPWPDLQKLTKAMGIRFIPTIMWSDARSIHNVLSNPVLRAAHIADIVDTVNKNNFDGIDIDYEAKFAETQPYYTLFHKELYKAMGKKWVQCTIEPRTPVDSRQNTTPVSSKDYANDYKSLAKYCDRVRVMAYDQASIDRKLTSAATGPYQPIADVRWVEKVVKVAMADIPKHKLMIGVATYGYEYKVTPLTSGYQYKHLWAFNPRYATDLAAQLGITPQRNVAGELSFIYRPQNVDPNTNVNSAAVLDAVSQVAQSASAVLDQSFNLLWWSDAEAIEDKIDLAKRLGVRGISIFKIDGGPDPKLWDVLPR